VELGETFLREAEQAGRAAETAVALRSLGMACLYQGDLSKAQEYLVRALKVYDPERDREASIRYGVDTGAGARYNFAVTKWYSGDVVQARKLIEEAIAYATQSGHIPTLSATYNHKAWLEVVRSDAIAALQTAETLVDLGQQHGLALWVAIGRYFSVGRGRSTATL
jgi:tetratricopeptide (TPR) repeat protein